MEEIQLTTATEAYLVMVLGIRLTQNSTFIKTDSLNHVLSLINFNEEPYDYSPIYKKLLQEVVDNGGTAFIEQTFKSAESDPYYDIDLLKHLQALYENSGDIATLLTMVEIYLQKIARGKCESEIEYGNSVKKSIEFLLKQQALYKTIIFKKNGKRSQEEIVSTHIYKIGKELDKEYKNLKITL